MLKATPHLPTGLMLIAAITLYSATPATAELERGALWQGAGIMAPSALRPDVRISLTGAPMVLGSPAGDQTLGDAEQLRFGGERALGARGHRHQHERGTLALNLADHVLTPLADAPRPGFASDLRRERRPAFLPDYRIGAWVAKIDLTAIELGRADRIRPGDAVPGPEPRSVMQIALAF
jgi:hypothetical protein